MPTKIETITDDRFIVTLYSVDGGQIILQKNGKVYYVTVFDRKKPGYSERGGGYVKDPLHGLLPDSVKEKILKNIEKTP